MKQNDSHKWNEQQLTFDGRVFSFTQPFKAKVDFLHTSSPQHCIIFIESTFRKWFAQDIHWPSSGSALALVVSWGHTHRLCTYPHFHQDIDRRKYELLHLCAQFEQSNTCQSHCLLSCTELHRSMCRFHRYGSNLLEAFGAFLEKPGEATLRAIRQESKQRQTEMRREGFRLW